MLQKKKQDAEGLFGQAHPRAVLAQAAALHFEFKRAKAIETHTPLDPIRLHHYNSKSLPFRLSLHKHLVFSRLYGYVEIIYKS
jgi:hypothetical protein